MITNVNMLAKPATPKVPCLVKISEVAKYLSVSPSTVHNLIQSGDLTASRINPGSNERKHFRVTRKSLLEFYQKRFGHSLTRALANPVEA